MAKKIKTLQENIDALDFKINKANAKSIELKKGNKNDKIVAALLDEKVNNSWVKQKEKLEKP